MKLYQIRVLVNSPKQTVFGITLPAYIAEKFSGISFTITNSGNCILLESGCSFEERKRLMPNRLNW